jgi:hypothetical protein
VTTELTTLTDDDLRAILAEVLHEHLAVQWVEGHVHDESALWAILGYLTAVSLPLPDALSGYWSINALIECVTALTYKLRTCERYVLVASPAWMRPLCRRTAREWPPDIQSQGIAIERARQRDLA